jgi:hypothetical protein
VCRVRRQCREADANAWLVTSRRREPFARDDGDRYASRLRAIAAQYRGEYSGFVEDDRD